MLTDLYVRNLAVVAEAEITFGPGLTVVSGETGAGKSLLVDALLLLTGARADSALVRDGAERTELGASFDLAHAAEARRWLQAEDLDDDNSCELRRVLKPGGSSRAWINGRPATLAQLAELAERLVEIHGQHEHQALLSRSHQLDLLDEVANAAEARTAVVAAVEGWQRVDARIRALGDDSARAARCDELRHAIARLEQWALDQPALAELEAEHRRLANADRLLGTVNDVCERLDGDHDHTVSSLLARARGELEALAGLDQTMAAQAELLESAAIQVGEVMHALNQHASGLQPDPTRLVEVEQHLSELHALSRRHQRPLAELRPLLAELADELESLEGAGADIEALTAEREAWLERYRTAAAELGEQRAAAGHRLGTEISALMGELGMAGGRFAVDLAATGSDTPDRLGNERCEFMVSANPGQALRPLRKVASGGELSRISLAIRVAASAGSRAPCMVFDEVDSGIGGAVAEVVGRKLRRLGEDAQVLCVTHLPQVAAQAHAHLRVHKASGNGDTQTRVTPLDEDARRAEVARMLGGIEISPETEAHARQMIDSARAG